MNELMETGTGPALPPVGDSYDTPTPKEDTSFLDTLQRETKDFLDKKHPVLSPVQDAIEMFTPLGAAAEVKSAGDSLVQASDEAFSGKFREALSSLVESATAGLGAFAPGPTSEQLQTLLGVFAGPMARRYNKEAAEQLELKVKELQDRGAKGEISPEEEEREIRLLLQDHYDENAQFYSPNPNNGLQQEIFDGDSRLNPTFFNENALNRGWTYNLNGVLDHPDLFDNYPDFKYLPVSATISKQGFGGAANSPTPNEPLGSIDLTVPSYRAFKFRYFENKNVDEETIKALYNDKIRGVLLHEVQHHIQRLEGFDRGSSPVSFTKASYSSQEPYLKLSLANKLSNLSIKEDDLNDFLAVVADANLNSETLADYIDNQPVHRLPEVFKELIYSAEVNGMSLGQFSDNIYRSTFDNAKYDWYTDKFGEVEARAVQERINYTSPDDSFEAPQESFDNPVIHYRTDKRQFNKGGLVPNMEDQTLEAFGEPEDPVSGNPIPPGGTPEGVRDDIDAKLSEGEYVLPAHVVRFIGVGKLEQLVQAVEQQLQKMEQGGRMGEPVQEQVAPQGMDEELPFDPNELESEEAPKGPMGFNQGGLVQDRVGNAPTVPNAPQTSVRLYRDRTGFIRAVPFVNGQAIGLVPEGAQEIPSGASPTTPSTQPAQQAQQQQMSNQTGRGVSEFERKEKDNVSYDISSLSAQEARDMLRGQNQIVDFLDSPYGTAAKAVTGPFGRFAAAAQQPIQQALADQVLSQEYGEESQGLLGALLGGTKLGNALGFDNRVQTLQDQDLVKEIRSNYTPPSSTRERVDTPTISRTTPSGRTVSSPVPTSRPEGLGRSSRSAPDSKDFGGDGGWSDAGQSVDNSRSSQGGFDGPGGLW